MEPPQAWRGEEQPRQNGRVADLAERMDRDGWTVVAEMATAHNPEAYLYTVGLTAQGLPELLIEGDPREHFALLWSLVRLLQARQGKPVLSPGRKMIVKADKRFLVQVPQTQNVSHNLDQARYVRHFFSMSEPKPTTLAVQVLDADFQAWSADCRCSSSCACCCMCETNPETGDLL